MRELSAKMPSMVDATLPSRDPATREGDTQETGDGGYGDATPVDVIRDTNHGAHGIEWQALDDNKPGWDVGEDEQKNTTWELSGDRIDENAEGAMPQRPEDEAGPEN